MELIDCRAAGSHEQEGKYRVDQAGQAGQDHAQPKPRGPLQMLAVRLTDGGGMFCEEAEGVHGANRMANGELRGFVPVE